MSTSEHSMITRSKKKEMESQPPNNAGNNDDIDEQGNIKGLIDYTCDEDFDNDMFQQRPMTFTLPELECETPELDEWLPLKNL